MDRGREPGFTLTELLIVIAVIAVVAAIAIPNFLAARLASNEGAAIATLRTLVSGQAQIQGLARIDTDDDAIGEFGTFVELTGASGVRTRLVESGTRADGSDFRTRGTPLDPPVLPPSLDNMEDSGFMVRGGYAFMIFLPDVSDPAQWVHEALRVRKRRKRILEQVVLANDGRGRNRIGVDLSESVWCAYAQPLARGSSGNRAFFTNQAGDILQSGNEVAAHQGSDAAIPGDSAFLGGGITSPLAVGTRGNDGDLWKLTQ